MTYVEDRRVYNELRAIAKSRGVSVGELIREAVTSHFKLTGDIQMRPIGGSASDEPQTQKKAPGKKA